MLGKRKPLFKEASITLIDFQTTFTTLTCKYNVSKTEAPFKGKLINWSLMLNTGYYSIIYTYEVRKAEAPF